MSLEGNKAIARRWNGELFGGGDLATALAAADRLVAPDYVDHALPPGLAPGLEGLKQQITIFYTAFPDVGSAIDDMIAEGDKVVARWHGWGTQRGEFFGLPPTGRSGTTSGIHIFRIAGGKIVEHWGNSDELLMNKNPEAFEELLSPDFVDHEGVPGVPPTRESVKQLIAAVHAAFSDFQVDIDKVVAQDDLCMSGKVRAGPASGQRRIPTGSRLRPFARIYPRILSRVYDDLARDAVRAVHGHPADRQAGGLEGLRHDSSRGRNMRGALGIDGSAEPCAAARRHPHPGGRLLAEETHAGQHSPHHEEAARLL